MQNNVEEGICAILADLLGRPARQIRPDMRLENSGVDSLTMIDLTVSIEERFGVAFPPDATPADLSIDTLGELVRYVERLIALKQSGAELH
jgi:acyl carrier protein